MTALPAFEDVADVAVTGTGLDLGPLAFVLASTEADLWSPGLLPGESFPEAQARREAARDIADALLGEFAGDPAETRWVA